MTPENYRSFMERCQIFLEGDACVRVSLAYKMSKFAHRHQQRRELDEGGDQLRYFEHPRRTALIALDELQLPVEELVEVCLLHDTYEDTRIEMDEIRLIHGPQVARAVALLSKRPKHGYWQRLRGHGDWLSLTAKGCDRLDNLRSLGAMPPEKQEAKRVETRRYVYPLLDLIAAPTFNPMYHKHGATLRDLVRSACDGGAA